MNVHEYFIEKLCMSYDVTTDVFIQGQALVDVEQL